MDKETLVQKGYDKLSENFHTFRTQFNNYKELRKFSKYLRTGGKILDAGCGVGIPVAQFFIANGFELYGIDISEGMLNKARENVPEAQFFQYNMVDLDFPDNHFDGLVSIYAMFHVPKQKHREIIKNFHRMLKKEGFMMLVFNSRENEGVDDFLGTDMYWSCHEPEISRELVLDAGFEIIFDEILDRGNELMYWVIAKK
ncbi:MAG: class I SAM-dependent methyltransferase [Candidatus Heimdallarchaeaceae archaeon]